MLLTVSRNELETTLKGAFLAVGLSWGEAADAAMLALWHEDRGIALHQQLPSILARIQMEGHSKLIICRTEASGAALDCGGRSLLAVGSAIVDFAVAELRLYGTEEIVAENAADVEFASALRHFLDLRGENARLRWVSGKRNAGRLFLAFCGSADIAADPPLPRLGGLDVDPVSWSRIINFAALTRVPESEKSRCEGAGIGADGD